MIVTVQMGFKEYRGRVTRFSFSISYKHPYSHSIASCLILMGSNITL